MEMKAYSVKLFLTLTTSLLSCPNNISYESGAQKKSCSPSSCGMPSSSNTKARFEIRLVAWLSIYLYKMSGDKFIKRLKYSTSLKLTMYNDDEMIGKEGSGNKQAMSVKQTDKCQSLLVVD